MKTFFPNTNHTEGILTPKQLVRRHMFDLQHRITEEEWKQLQVGSAADDAEIVKARLKSKALAFINSDSLREN